MRAGGGALTRSVSVDLFDTLTLDGARRTGDGYLVADVRVARTGIQLYRGAEVGRPDKDVVRVYRPEAEVFAEDALKSFAWRPVTMGHPKDAVSADNWRKLAVGQVGDEVRRDGDFIRVPLVLMDAATIREVEAGTKQLSMGYSAELDWVDGTTPSGEQYDAVQRSIRGNHLAIVTQARGGPALTIGDDEKQEKAMPKILVDGIEVEVGDASAAAIINRYVTQSSNAIDALKKKLEEEEAKSKKAAEAKDAEMAVLKADHQKAIEAKDAETVVLKKAIEDAKVTPAMLDALAKDRGDAVEKARKVLGDKLVVDGKSTAEVKRQAVDAYLGDHAKGFTDEQIAVAFTTMTAKDAAAAAGRPDPVRETARAGFVRTNDSETVKAAALAEHDSYLTDAWRGPKAA